MDDEQRFGEALAKTMDRLSKFREIGGLDGYELNEVLVVAAFTKPYEDADQEIEADAMESLVFVDGTTQIPYVQMGILEMARDTAHGIE